MSDESTWHVFGNTLYLRPEPGPDFVVFPGDAGAAHIIAEAHNAALADCRGALATALDELERHQAASGAAARVLIQKDDRIGTLESQLGQAHELLRTLEAAREDDARTALDELARMQVRLDQAVERTGYLERMLEHQQERADQAEVRASILQAQLGSWEAACAAQVKAARIYLDALANTAHNGPQLAARGRLANAIDSIAERDIARRAWKEQP